jgi:hypothetical protein
MDGWDREIDGSGASTDAAFDASGNDSDVRDVSVDSTETTDAFPAADARAFDTEAGEPAFDLVDARSADGACDGCDADVSWSDTPIDAPFDRAPEFDRVPEDGSDATADAGCTGPTVCETGAIRCEARGGFVCEQREGCAVWVQRLDCPDEKLCCAQGEQLGCVVPSAQNCYGCGRRCAGEMPFCSEELRRCICDPSTCGHGTGCDQATGSCAPCTTLGPDATDFYVDAKASALGTGSAICPVPTITAALNMANRSKAQAKTIHVNGGAYTFATETFPLVVANGIAIEGAGADKVTITGLGFYRSEAPALRNDLRATVVIGSPDRINAIRHVTLTPGEGVRVGSVAVAVVDGNLAAGDGGIPDAPPNSIVANTVIGPGYNVGIHMLASVASGSGGNVQVLNSTILGSMHGVYAWGCSVDHPTQFYGRVEVTNSLLTSLTTGVEFYGCTGVSLKGTTIRDSAIGVYMRPDVAADVLRLRTEFLFNTFERLTTFGIYSVGVVDEISNNTFSSIVSDGEGPAFALFLDGYQLPHGSVLRARGNRFVGNDVAIVLYSSNAPGSIPLGETNVYDFGTASDHGQNHFRCNSSSVSKVIRYKGYDVAIDAPAAAGWAFHLHGNGWDHVPPFFMTGPDIHDIEPDFPDGADLFIGNGKPITSVDVGGAFRSGAPCDSDHISGPAHGPQDAGLDAPAND